MGRAWMGVLFSLLIVILLSVGCGPEGSNGSPVDDAPYIAGIIYTVENDHILIVDGIEDMDIAWFEEGYPAVNFKITENTIIRGLDGSSILQQELESGMEVQAWVEGLVRESYPEQAEAKRIVVVSKGKALDTQGEPVTDAETSEDEASDTNGTNRGNDDTDERVTTEREDEITIPGLFRALSTVGMGETRPATKELPFGGGALGDHGERRLTFRLVNSPHMPFSTYIPGKTSNSGYRLLAHGHLHGEYSFIEEKLPPHGADFQLLRISDALPEASHMGQYLDILFLNSSTGLEKAGHYLKQRLETRNPVPLMGQFPDWLVEAYTFGGKNNTDDTRGFAALGAYKGQHFLLYSVWNRADEEAWLQAVRVILEEWSWKTEGQSRPPEQVFTVFIEGNEEHAFYRLIDFPHIPFTAYFPVDLIVEPMQTGQLQGVRLGHMDIMFFPENMTKRAAEMEFELVLSYLGDMSPVPPEEVPCWALAKYTGWDRSNFKTGILGEYRGRYFYMREQYPQEYGDGWSPVRSILFSTWRWKDDDGHL